MPLDKKKKRVIRNASVISLKQPPSNYVYSVDDDLDELEKDLEREYLEGYNDALRLRYKRSKDIGNSSNTSQPISPITATSTDYIQHKILSNLINADSNLKKLESLESDPNSIHKHHNHNHNHHTLYQQLDNNNNSSSKLNQLNIIPSTSSKLKDQQFNENDISNDIDFNYNDDEISSTITPFDTNNNSNHNSNNNNYNINNINNNEQQDDQEEEDNEDDEYDDNLDNESISSLESFTLRERQNAINKTHPFGIRIWKPALYKKIRSVEREADQDIHEIDESEDSNNENFDNINLIKKQKKTINWSVHFANVFWALTFGLTLLILSLIGSSFILLIELFTSRTIQYSKVFFNLGIYLLWPFGKIVYLQKDVNYLSEDQNEGTTIHEYQRWRDEEQTKLFFSSSHSQDQQQQQSQQSQSHPNPNEPSTSILNIQDLENRSSSNRSYNINTPKNHGNNDTYDENDKKLRFFGRGDWSFGRIVFYLYFYVILQPVMYAIWLICWLLIVTIPMSKVLGVLTNHLRRHPLALFFKFDSYFFLPQQQDSSLKKNNSNVLVCTYRSSGLHYWKYTVDGTNVILINLLFVVIFTILDFYLFKEYFNYKSPITDESFIFALCLLSIVPLAYFIGQAVASISAQSSMGVGAVINAFFSTIVEIFLYCVALDQNKGQLVEGSMIGSILGGVLLLPGLSMCAGAFIRKTQRYNPASAGVSSTMLLFSMCVMFAPTVFQQIYGTYEIKCVPCQAALSSITESAMTAANIAIESIKPPKPTCQTCQLYQPPLIIDDLFLSVLEPFSIGCAVMLFLAYTIGLWFTLRTHAALIWSTPIADPVRPKLPIQSTEASIVLTGGAAAANTTTNPPPAPKEPQEQPQGHDAPNWSRQKSTIVLLSATLFYAIIAEILVDCVDSVLKNFPINPKFLGITIFALVPNTTEFLNAISFATHGNVALSMEIGSAYALQVCLIQIPSLVLYSIFTSNLKFGDKTKDGMFTLVFPNWDLIATVVSVGIFTYVYAEGKSNYFKGSILILIYLVVLGGFWYTGEIDSVGGFTRSFTLFV